MNCEDNSPILEVESLSVAYLCGECEVLAARDISFSLYSGEILSVVGESGSGKSTLAMAIPRLLPEPPARINAKSIKICGTEVALKDREALRPLRGSRIGTIFQEPMTALSPLHSIGKQLGEAIFLHRSLAKNERRALSLEWLGKVGLPDPQRAFDAYPYELSGGMQQRVMIAMALINDPDLVIADEPTTALDATTQSQILDLMKRLVSKRSAMILITHDMGVVKSIATKVFVMYSGRIVEKAAAQDLFANPLHPYTKALLASMPNLKTRGTRLPVIEGFVPSLQDASKTTTCHFHPRCVHKASCPGDIREISLKDKCGPHSFLCSDKRKDGR